MIHRCKTVAELAEVADGDVRKLLWELGKSVPWTDTKDREDIDGEARRTMKRGKGDCWSMACVVYCVLGIWGWKRYILVACPKKSLDQEWSRHAVCVFEMPDGTVGYTSNSVLR